MEEFKFQSILADDFLEFFLDYFPELKRRKVDSIPGEQGNRPAVSRRWRRVRSGLYPGRLRWCETMGWESASSGWHLAADLSSWPPSPTLLFSSLSGCSWPWTHLVGPLALPGLCHTEWAPRDRVEAAAPPCPASLRKEVLVPPGRHCFLGGVGGW